MNVIDCEVLAALYDNNHLTQRALSDRVGVSLGKINKSLKDLRNSGYLDAQLNPTAVADMLVADYKPASAVILAAGLGLRMIPLCRDLPKALLEVKGEILIERLICQLHDVGIEDVYVVVGYMKEKFEYLIDKYRVKLVVNSQFDTKSNLYSLGLVSDKLQNSYIIPCDIYCEDNPFRRVETYSWYMVSDKLCSKSTVAINRNRELVLIKNNALGNQEIGIAYLGGEQSRQVASRVAEFQKPEYYNQFWECVAIVNDKFLISAKPISHTKVHEINTYDDLIGIDAYSKSLNSEYIDIICDSLHVRRENISHITAQKAGMTNRSFLFCCNEQQYIFRIPGEGTDQLINRQQEFDVYQQICDKNLCDEIIYINPENGYKITRFIDNARNCDPSNLTDVEACMTTLRNFHNMRLTVRHTFDIFEQLFYYETLRNRQSMYEDYDKTKKHVLELKTYIDRQEKEFCLCHIDSVCDNFIFSNDRIYLIDWEYAGMQDPHVDIAMFAIYALYDKAQIDQLIDFYFCDRCDKRARLKIYCYIAACGLLWSNWCEYKASLGETFGEYSLTQYRYAKDFYQYFKEETTNESC